VPNGIFARWCDLLMTVSGAEGGPALGIDRTSSMLARSAQPKNKFAANSRERGNSSPPTRGITLNCAKALTLAAVVAPD
jgi:hypothetical protein